MKKVGNVILIILLLIFTVFHFSVIALHAGPLNPVKTNSINFVERYTYPLLVQNWQLFAPDPINVTSHVLVQYKTKDGTTSEWHNISTPLTEANKNNPVSGYNKASRIPTGIYHDLFYQGELVEEYRKAVDVDKFNEDINMDQIQESKEKHVDILYRFAFSSVPLITNDEVDEVNVRIVNWHPVPFSERFNSEYERESEFTEFGWKKYIPVLTY